MHRTRFLPHCSECTTPTACDKVGACQLTGHVRLQALETKEAVNHPAHYGGADNPYEVIKVLYAWKLDTNFCLGNVVKYIVRHEHKNSALEDLKKARWYLDEHIKHLEHSK